MNIQQALGQALSAMDIGSQVPIEFAPVDLNDYSRQITLDLGSVVYLPDKPASYVADSYYQQFEYTLPVDFIEAGNPKLKSYTGWSDDVGVKAVQFTFSNGKTEVQTPVFGNTTPTYLTSKTVAMTDYVKTVDTKMLTTVTFGQTVFGIVNFKFNGQNSTQMGPEDPKGATATSPTRNTFSSGINANQKIVGVYGLKQTSSGSLRSFNFKVANEVHAVSQDEYYNQVETDFVRKTGQLNSDPSLMSALSLDD